MPLTSPGPTWAVITVTLIVTSQILVMNVLADNLDISDDDHHEDSSETIVVDIGNVEQPENCSQFLNDLEVRFQEI